MTMRGKKPGYVQAVLDALKDYGPMTMQDLMVVTNQSKASCSRTVCSLNREWPRTPKRVYIKAWVYDQEGQKRYPRAVYALGDRWDAAKPERDNRATQKRSRDKKRLLSAVNSVFNLGRLSRGGYTRARRDHEQRT